jgi:ATP-dependent RNA helicase DeaD
MKRLERLSIEDLVSRLLSVEFNRFLNYYKNAPDLNVNDFENAQKQKGRRKENEDKKERGNRYNADAGDNYTRLFLNIGRKEWVEPPQIIEMLCRGADNRRIDVGRIDIYDGFTYVDVDADYVDDILDNLNGLNFRGRTLRVDIATPRENAVSNEKKYSPVKKKKSPDKKKRKFEGRLKKKKSRSKS